ncbi:MAG: hypothetical protein IKM02_06885 [Clostridia bacterium]|nr:hypothetical protein [Clostridia bacterium]
MHPAKQIVITGIPEISAIYFALLQCGYDYYSIERNKDHNDALQHFMGVEDASPFFSGTKQNTCEVYPYWPRAAILETASFYLSPDHSQFQSYDRFRRDIMSSGNIADCERDKALWKWIEGFPAAISGILSSDAFSSYLRWEKNWIKALNVQYETELQMIQSCLDVCMSKYGSQVEDIQIVVSPIKCVYSADYHLIENRFIFTSGKFTAHAVIHEFLHHVVHPVIKEIKGCILRNKQLYPGLDNTYYLSGDDTGHLNAFEEYAVRKLTNDILTQNYPASLSSYLVELA